MLHIHRWRNLHIVAQSADIYSGINRFRYLHAPFLQSMSLTSVGDEVLHASVDLHGHVFTGGAPISSLTLNNIALQACLPPLASLTRLSLCDVARYKPWTLIQFRAMLTACAPTLIELSINGLATEFCAYCYVPLAYVPVTLPCLRALWLSGGGWYVTSIIKTFTAPQLEFLSLNGIQTTKIRRDFEILGQGPGPRFPSTKSLTISRTPPLNPPRSLFPTSFGDITHLTYLYVGSDELLLSLASDSELLVDLRTLTIYPLFDGAKCQHHYEKVLCDMLTARMSQGRAIIQLRLDACSLQLMGNSRMEWLKERVGVESLTSEPTNHI
jgi:hypothetical protein